MDDSSATRFGTDLFKDIEAYNTARNSHTNTNYANSNTISPRQKTHDKWNQNLETPKQEVKQEKHHHDEFYQPKLNTYRKLAGTGDFNVKDTEPQSPIDFSESSDEETAKHEGQ